MRMYRLRILSGRLLSLLLFACVVAASPRSACAQSCVGLECVGSQEAKLTADVRDAFDNFGYSADIDGDYAIVGSPEDDDRGSDAGAAFIYMRNGSTWPQQQKLYASDPGVDHRFGTSVSISGDRAAVGTLLIVASQDRSGAAYIFLRTGVTWSQEARIVGSDTAPEDGFGGSLDLDADTLVVGAPGRADHGTKSGAAYVFIRSGTSWPQQQKLEGSDEAAEDLFGAAVAVSGDRIVVGAPNHTGIGAIGQAYIFERTAGVWTEKAILTPSDGAPGDAFGYAVAIDGDTAIVSSRYKDRDTGAAYVFVRDGAGVWSQQAKITPCDPAVDSVFGTSVGVSGDLAVVGASGDPAFGSFAGAAHVYQRTGTTWAEKYRLASNDIAPGDDFGGAVAIKGTRFVAGAIGESPNPFEFAGAAYIFWTERCNCPVENHPPTCSSACLVPFECAGPGGTTVDFTVTVSDQDGDPISSVTCSGPGTLNLCSLSGSTVHVRFLNVPLGTQTYTIAPTDSRGGAGSCQVCATVQDTIAPVGQNCNPIVRVPLPGTCSVRVSKADWIADVGTRFADTCDGATPFSELWDTTNLFPIGSYNVAFESTDASGNEGTCEAGLTVAPPPPPPVDCPTLFDLGGGLFRVDWTKPRFCDGTCCTPEVNGIGVENTEVIEVVFSLEERVVIIGGRKVFYTSNLCLSTTCDNGFSGCPATCTGVSGQSQAFLPFFREDPRGTNKPGTIVVLSNRNAGNARVRIDVYDCGGNSLLPGGYLAVVAAQGNDRVPPAGSRLRLRDLLSPTVTSIPIIGNIVVTTLGPANPPVDPPLTHRVEGRLYVQPNGDDINTPGGFTETSQWESSSELWEDYFLNIHNGMSANFNVREFLVVTNPSAVDTAQLRVDFYNVSGALNPFPRSPASASIPPHGCFIYNTAGLDPTPGPILEGNAVVHMLPNTSGVTVPTVGISVCFGPSDGHNDTDPTEPPTEGNPVYGSDLRTDLRK